MHIPLFSKGKKTQEPYVLDSKIVNYKRPPTLKTNFDSSSQSSKSNSNPNISENSSSSPQSHSYSVSTSSVFGNSVNIEPIAIDSGNGSKPGSYRYPQPPTVNPHYRNRSNSKPVSINYEDAPSSPSSLTKRQVSDRVKNTPSSFVRHSRVYSSDFEAPMVHSDSFTSINKVSHSKNANSFSNFLIANKSVPSELSPIVTLFNCHNFRNYYSGRCLIHSDSLSNWVEVSAKITGNELSIWVEDDEGFNPIYYNLFDYTINLDLNDLQIKFSNDLNEIDYNLIVKVPNLTDYKDWVTALYLSDYERLSLSESFTAVVLSLIGPRLSDIQTLLSKKKYVKYDWCKIRLPQINHKWVLCYLAIYPSTSKKLGKIEIYSTDKVSKKNLLCYITNVKHVYNIFPENVNMIEFNSIMKVQGEVYVNSKFEHLFAGSGLPQTQSRSRSSSNPMGPSNTKSHKRVASQSSFFSTSSSPPSSPKVKSSTSFIITNYLYMMPESHPGVQEIETMIRNFIPIIDAFRLYGRPKQLSSDKFDQSSLLFGLPSLPNCEYLTFSDAKEIVDIHLNEASDNRWGCDNWNFEFKLLIEYKMANEKYRGSGNVVSLYESLELDDSDILSVTSFPEVNLSRYTADYSPSPLGSPMRTGTSPLPRPVTEMSPSPNPMYQDRLSPVPIRFDNSDLPDPSVSGSPVFNNKNSRLQNASNFDSIDGITSPMKQLGTFDELDDNVNIQILQVT